MSATYGTMYGMVKTTLYLSEELKAHIERVARAEQRSEADVIREVLTEGLARRARPRPRGGIFDSGDPDWAATADRDLDGFGE
ncbi:MAG: ribbon-helix-helix protein, CopG family [Nitriliruptorales bacterium]|nr:ribbon-helix-helix protein, CopG family [Nitriliruptorales bacterium]